MRVEAYLPDLLRVADLPTLMAGLGVAGAGVGGGSAAVGAQGVLGGGREGGGGKGDDDGEDLHDDGCVWVCWLVDGRVVSITIMSLERVAFACCCLLRW